MHQGELAKHKYPQFKKIQEFALGTGVMFHILFKSDENNARKSIFFMNMIHMSLSLETKKGLGVKRGVSKSRSSQNNEICEFVTIYVSSTKTR